MLLSGLFTSKCALCALSENQRDCMGCHENTTSEDTRCATVREEASECRFCNNGVAHDVCVWGGTAPSFSLQ